MTREEHYAKPRVISDEMNEYRINKIRQTQRAKAGKITFEEADRIAHSDSKMTTEAVRYGVSKGTIWKIRKQKPNAKKVNVWGGLISKTPPPISQPEPERQFKTIWVKT
jgi:hypothetical protein